MKKNSCLKMFFLISLILIQVTHQKFLQFNPKTNCPKAPMSSLGVLISLADTEFLKALLQKEKNIGIN